MTLIVRPGFQFDTDASNYIEAVEAADQADTPGIGAMETGVRYAINDFVIGCKNDGVWTAIKNCCILAGAKTLEGSFIDLKSCTKVLANNNFADGTYSGSNYTTGDYNRETGLLGNGSTKRLNSNRAGNADPINNAHASVYVTTIPTTIFSALIGNENDVSGSTNIGTNNPASSYFFRCQNSSASVRSDGFTGLAGVSRNNSANYVTRASAVNQTVTAVSQSPPSTATSIFAFTSGTNYSNARLAFYSIGESLDLAALDNRVSILIAQFGAVIP
jgi:hypothetical protein